MHIIPERNSFILEIFDKINILFYIFDNDLQMKIYLDM